MICFVREKLANSLCEFNNFMGPKNKIKNLLEIPKFVSRDLLFCNFDGR